MLYLEQRQELLSSLQGLKEERLIDRGGGALSLRCPDGNIIISTTGSQFKGWQLDEHDFIVLDPEGRIVEMEQKLGPAGTPVHLALYRLFPECNAAFHTHAPYSLVFAALNRPVPSTTFQMDLLGEVPCLYSDDNAIKKQFEEDPYELRIPEGMVQKPALVAISNVLIAQVEERFTARRPELKRHGLAFTTPRKMITDLTRYSCATCRSTVKERWLENSKVPDGCLLKDCLRVWRYSS